ncbi:hypothetical protein BR63_17555 [Thermanaerosceptrum fracticalcis]|uniref:Gamma-glutamylcyclotransferase AIG2-like domain-containing protein n=1 Tax=Thermanaerosceptrum fracticalcis TaxID=1712410 RepID=A0A7G6E749_THEFR|nr:gamma-glutamylcyclotransferase family protein [Thermanaerosceptrum fracticalcis]QNB47903.1 hypothetical protein BR63_17555 [Thermanaerosceptrum fracticalcis]
MMERQEDCLFVYGSLLTGTNDPEIDRIIPAYCRYIAEGYILAELYDLGEYPGAIPCMYPEAKVYGKVFEVLNFAECFNVLDEYEGYYANDLKASEFMRSKTPVRLLTGEDTVMAWVYYYNGEIKDEPQIISGNYVQYKRDKDKISPAI